MSSSNSIQQAYIVPGLPHLAFGTGGWDALRKAYTEAGEKARAAKPDVYVIYSAQWISVLGHSFQMDPNPKGIHVDENWYDLGDFEFNFKVDIDLAAEAERFAQQAGLATKGVHYEGFPIDTGTLVAMKYFNPDNTIPVMIVSSNIYCDKADSVKLGEAVASALKKQGKKAVAIACTTLSNRFHTVDTEPANDSIASEKDDAWNRKVLALIEAGKNDEVMALGETYAQEANPEMAFKAYYWLMGLLGTPATPGKVMAYGPVWGTGNAVVQYQLASV